MDWLPQSPGPNILKHRRKALKNWLRLLADPQQSGHEFPERVQDAWIQIRVSIC